MGDVGDVDLKKVEVKDKASVDWWDGEWDDSMVDSHGEAAILWGVGRTVSAESTSWGGPELGLNILGHYSGLAKARVDTEKEATETDADCKGMSVKVCYNGARCDVQHNFGTDMKDKDTSSPMLAVPELGLRATLNEGFESSTYTIFVEETVKDPVHALLIGFILARYMHPKRAEQRAAEKAEDIAEDAAKKDP